MTEIYLTGSKGKIGSLISKELSAKKHNLTNYLILDRPPYDFEKSLNAANKKKIVILCIYTKNLKKYINTIINLSNLFSSSKNILFIEVCSLIQLAKISEIIRNPKYLFYYFNRRILSMIFTLIFEIFNKKSTLKIFFGKVSSKKGGNIPLSTINPSLLCKAIISSIHNYNFKSNSPNPINIILCNKNHKFKKDNIDILLDNIIKKNLDNKKFKINF